MLCFISLETNEYSDQLKKKSPNNSTSWFEITFRKFPAQTRIITRKNFPQVSKCPVIKTPENIDGKWALDCWVSQELHAMTTLADANHNRETLMLLQCYEVLPKTSSRNKKTSLGPYCDSRPTSAIWGTLVSNLKPPGSVVLCKYHKQTNCLISMLSSSVLTAKLMREQIFKYNKLTV